MLGVHGPYLGQQGSQGAILPHDDRGAPCKIVAHTAQFGHHLAQLPGDEHRMGSGIVAHGASFAADSAACRSVWAFSSPGKVVMPSHGETKSKLRKSCCRVTGSLMTCLRSSS